MTPSASVAHHRAGQFLAGDKGLDQHGLAEAPVGAREFLRRVLHVLAHDKDADTRAFGHRLDHVRRRQQMALGRLAARDHHAARHRYAGSLEHGLGNVLLYGQRGSKHAGMAVRDAEDFQHALQRAVLAGAAVQHIEGDVGFEGAQVRRHLARDVEPADPIAARSAASAQALPDHNETSRSADQPPINTATCLAISEPSTSPPSCPRLSRASTTLFGQVKTWMSGSSPAMTKSIIR